MGASKIAGTQLLEMICGTLTCSIVSTTVVTMAPARMASASAMSVIMGRTAATRAVLALLATTMSTHRSKCAVMLVKLDTTTRTRTCMCQISRRYRAVDMYQARLTEYVTASAHHNVHRLLLGMIVALRTVKTTAPSTAGAASSTL